MSQDGPKLRAAVIGCGMIGAAPSPGPETIGVLSHAEAYVYCSHTQLVGLCDVSETTLREAGLRYQCSGLYTDLDRLLNDVRPELISIATPDALHYPQMMRVLDEPGIRGVLLEKPMASSVAEARIIVDRAAERNIKLAVNYSRRYSSRFRELIRFVQQGGIGDIQTISGVYTKGIRHNGTHWIDLLLWFDSSILDVSAVPKVDDTEEDPTPDVYFRLADGTAFLHACDKQAYTVFEMDLLGTIGRLRIVDGGHGIEYYSRHASPSYVGHHVLVREPAPISGDMKNVIGNAVQDLVDSVLADREPQCSGLVGLQPLRVSDAILDSLARGGSRVEVQA